MRPFRPSERTSLSKPSRDKRMSMSATPRCSRPATLSCIPATTFASWANPCPSATALTLLPASCKKAHWPSPCATPEAFRLSPLLPLRQRKGKLCEVCDEPPVYSARRSGCPLDCGLQWRRFHYHAASSYRQIWSLQPERYLCLRHQRRSHRQRRHLSDAFLADGQLHRQRLRRHSRRRI